MKYNPKFLFIPLFLSDSRTGQTARQIFIFDGSNDAHSCKGVSFLAFVDIAAHLGG